MSPSPIRALSVDPSLRGIRLQDYLYREFPSAHRVAVRAAMLGGCVQVNGMTETRNLRLRPMDYVQIDVSGLRSHEAPSATKRTEDAGVQSAGTGDAVQDVGPRATAPTHRDQLEVLHETATVLVVSKPAGLPTVPDRSGKGDSVHSRLAGLRPDADLRIAHRLDRDTSGCLVLAKGIDAARHLDVQFREGHVQKEYLALVGGRVARARQTVERFLGPDPRRPGKVVASATLRRGFRQAVTEVEVEDAFDRFTVLRLRPRTGRGHQLRVHLQSIAHPIVGDTDYGGEALLLSRIKAGYKLRSGVAERPLLARMFLHAAVLRFEDVCGTAVAVEASLPSDLQLALDKVRRFCRRS